MKVRNLIAALALVAALAPPLSAEDDWLTKGVDWLYDKRDQLQDVVTKSVKGVADAMDEGGSRNDWRPNESTIDYNLRKYDEYDHDYKRSLARLKGQQQLLNIDARLLQKLPKDDPRRAEIAAELSQVATQMPGTRADVTKHHDMRAAFDKEIQRYKHETGSYPPHDCNSAPGWHLPAGAKCNGASTDSHADPGHDDH